MIAAFFDSTESRNRVLDSLYAQLLQRPIDPIGQANSRSTASTGIGNNRLIVTLLSSQVFLTEPYQKCSSGTSLAVNWSERP